MSHDVKVEFSRGMDIIVDSIVASNSRMRGLMAVPSIIVIVMTLQMTARAAGIVAACQGAATTVNVVVRVSGMVAVWWQVGTMSGQQDRCTRFWSFDKFA